jgi:hypothetical protein
MKESITKIKRTRDSMRTAYDFSAGARGRYANAYRRGTNVVLLNPDVARKFKTSKAVDDALRTAFRSQK